MTKFKSDLTIPYPKCGCLDCCGSKICSECHEYQTKVLGLSP
jgi:hypothetical protein